MAKKKKTDNIQKKREMDRETLENTMRIRIDRERIEDSESLDTSFLEGRAHKRVQNNKTAKEKILIEKKPTISFPFFKIIKILLLIQSFRIIYFTMYYTFSSYFTPKTS